MSDQEKKRQRIYDLLNAETKKKFLCLPYTNLRRKIYRKSFLRKKGNVGLNKNEKKAFQLLSLRRLRRNPHNINKKVRKWVESSRKNCEGSN